MFTKQPGRIAVVLLATMIMASTALAASSSSWPTAGHDTNNTRFQDTETKLKSQNVDELGVKWQFTTGGDVSATPALDGTNVYFPDWAGNLYAVNQKTGALLWQHQISEYTGIPGDWARNTPAIVGNELILGDQAAYSQNIFASASVFAVNKQTGALIWKTVVDSGPFPIITQSAVVDQSTATPVAYIGVASAEEGFAAFGFPCCSSRGSIMAMNALTGAILWKTYTVPAGYSGGAVWGSTPVIDFKRGSLYIGTGNNYSLPQSVYDCINNGGTAQSCIAPDDYFDSVMALDRATGAVKWVTKALPSDAWNVSCVLGDGSNCPANAGPDYDFGQGPTLFTVTASDGAQTDILGAGQKSGQYWALNPDSGTVKWVTQVGPGGTLGGLEWGSAMDGKRIYVSIANSEQKSWTPKGQQTPITWGGWSALDPATGQILWQTPDPNQAIDPGAVTVANGVVYGCSMDPQGNMYAMNAATGAIRWSFASGGSCNAGASIANGVVYWGSGYSRFGTGNNQFYAFTLP